MTDRTARARAFRRLAVACVLGCVAVALSVVGVVVGVSQSAGASRSSPAS